MTKTTMEKRVKLERLNALLIVGLCLSGVVMRQTADSHHLISFINGLALGGMILGTIINLKSLHALRNEK